MKKNLKEQIKEMEAKKREEATPVIEAETQVTFDSWFHQRKPLIPKCHVKEILQADFKARGLGLKATMAAYDKALELYGVKLK
jgi:hypothetical protein